MKNIYRKIKGLVWWTADCIKGWATGLKEVTNTKSETVLWSCYQTFFHGSVEETEEKRGLYDIYEKDLISKLKSGR